MDRGFSSNTCPAPDAVPSSAVNKPLSFLYSIHIQSLVRVRTSDPMDGKDWTDISLAIAFLEEMIRNGGMSLKVYNGMTKVLDAMKDLKVILDGERDAKEENGDNRNMRDIRDTFGE